MPRTTREEKRQRSVIDRTRYSSRTTKEEKRHAPTPAPQPSIREQEIPPVIGGTPESAGYTWDYDRWGWYRVWDPENCFIPAAQSPEGWRSFIPTRPTPTPTPTKETYAPKPTPTITPTPTPTPSIITKSEPYVTQEQPVPAPTVKPPTPTPSVTTKPGVIPEPFKQPYADQKLPEVVKQATYKPVTSNYPRPPQSNLPAAPKVEYPRRGRPMGSAYTGWKKQRNIWSGW